MRCLILLSCLFLMAGCVSSKKYNASLDDISRLNEEVVSLNEILKTGEAKQEELSAEITRLKKKQTELMEANGALMLELESEGLGHINELASLRAEISRKDLEAKSLDTELDLARTRIMELEQRLEQLEKEKALAIEAKKAAVSELQGTYEDLMGQMKEEIEKGRVEVRKLKDKLSLSMVDKILFNSGKAEVNSEGRKVLDRVAEVLSKVEDKEIRIEGHTDNEAIGPRLAEKYATNWELSAARAINVVRYLSEEGGVDPALMSAAGYSMHRPVALNDTAKGRARNRRIEIVLSPFEPAAASEPGAEPQSSPDSPAEEPSKENI